jgi:hypothetical protein
LQIFSIHPLSTIIFISTMTDIGWRWWLWGEDAEDLVDVDSTQLIPYFSCFRPKFSLRIMKDHHKNGTLMHSIMQ